jgi:hypothetical protein
MVPPLHGDTTIYDKAEMWVGKSLEEIANYRLALVRGVMPLNVFNTTGRYIENLQDLAMSQNPVDSEIIFEKNPFADIELEHELQLSPESAPFGPAAQIKTFKASPSSSSADQKIESVFYDGDLNAKDAVIELYNNGIETSRIQRVMSIGMVGVKKNRRLVPTRWSITATDDIISAHIIKENETNPAIGHFEVKQYSHLGNYYSVILIPESVWSFEMIESWYTADGKMAMGADYEDARGLDHYPSIAGAYFAARLAVAEHLSKQRRNAAALVLREIHPEYVMPVGVWQVREGVRQALQKTTTDTFDSLQNALAFACSKMSLSNMEIQSCSTLYRNFYSQTKITDY